MASRQGRLDRVVVPTVDVDGVPPLDLESLRDAAGPSVVGAGIVDDDRCQAIEAETSGNGDGFVNGALLELAVTQEHEDTTRPTVDPDSDGHPDTECETVPERAGGDLHTRNEESIGMVTEGRVERAERENRSCRCRAGGRVRIAQR